MRDPYVVLGVSRTAGADEIKTAYRRLARECHPDADPGNPWAEQEFKELAQAYALLSDATARARYDRGEIDANGTGRRGRRTRPGGSSGAKTGGHGRIVKIKGANVSYEVTVGLLDAAHGVTKTLDTTSGKTLSVRIPPGTTDGQVLRLKGQGMPGFGGGGAGDALVEVHVEPRPDFERDGDDVRIEVPVTLAEAVLGGRIEAPTIDGPVSVTVPPGSNTGTVLRLRGKGLARNDGDGDGGGRGDQYVSLRVVLPPKPDPELTRFVEQWSTAHPYTVRRAPK